MTTVSSGQTSTGLTSTPSNEVYVSAGGTAINTTVDSGSVMDVVGGVESATTILSGGTDEVIQSLAFHPFGSSSPGQSINDKISSGGTLLVQSGGTESGATDGGAIYVSSAGNLTGVTTITSGGFINFANGAAGTGVVSFAGSGGTVAVSNTMPTNVISNFERGDNIDYTQFASAAITSVSASGNTLTLYDGGSAYALTVEGIGSLVSSDGFDLVSDGHGGTFFEICFAGGTRLATPAGEVAVELLQTGDMVDTLSGPKPIVWIGYRTANLAKMKDPELARLVRIKAGAVSDGVPSRDLLVTQEHCIFIDGCLIPARMLVNGRSIISDRTINTYTYYHVELERHGILFAEGLTTESYLDTGNRSGFANHPVPDLQASFSVNASHKSWETDACAPLMVERGRIEPIWNRLSERAQDMQFRQDFPRPAITEDPLLRLSNDAGLEIRPIRKSGNRYLFLLPSNSRALRLKSRTFRPADAIGPFVDDRRDLGVLVGNVALWSGCQAKKVNQHLSVDSLHGWHRIEAADRRWTAGNAEIPVSTAGQALLLEVEVLGGGPYLLTTAAEDDIGPVAPQFRLGTLPNVC